MLMFATRRVVASAACRRFRLSCAASQERTSSASGRIPTSAAWDTLSSTSRRRQVRSFATDSSGVGGVVEVTKTEGASSGTSSRNPIANAGGADANRPSISTDESTCSHGISTDPNLLDREGDDEDDEMEAMFVEPDACLGTSEIEWGGPRRGGRFAEPTRFGDWERKGRCTDF